MNENFFNVKTIDQISQNPYNNNNFIEEPKSSNRHLNGYDSHLLNDKQDSLQNETLQIETKIDNKQKELMDINGKIKRAELYGTQNELLTLKARKQQIENEIIELNKKQNFKKNSIKILNDEITKMNGLKKMRAFIGKHILSKVSKRYNVINFLGESLQTLALINRNVDALLEMDMPYGEAKENYLKLTNYLTKANKIHSHITKTMKNI